MLILEFLNASLMLFDLIKSIWVQVASTCCHPYLMTLICKMNLRPLNKGINSRSGVLNLSHLTELFGPKKYIEEQDQKNFFRASLLKNLLTLISSLWSNKSATLELKSDHESNLLWLSYRTLMPLLNYISTILDGKRDEILFFKFSRESWPYDHTSGIYFKNAP